MLETAIQTTKPPSSESFETAFVASRPKIQQLVKEMFAEIRKYLLFRQNIEVMDIVDADTVHKK
jgi:hypothetical protein